MVNGSLIGFKRALRNAIVEYRYSLHGRLQPKIFCIGFNKTGTTSLYRALVREGVKVGDQPTAERLLNEYVAGNFEPIVAYCKSARVFQDIPFSLPGTYRPLYRAYPDAKFILSIRDSGEQWFASQIRAASSRLGKVPTLADLKEVEYCWKGWSFEYHQAVFGKAVEFEDREAKIDVYNQHIADVQDYFHAKPDQLLTVNVAEEGAFSAFCEFLGIRSAYSEFPWANQSLVTPSN